MVVVPLLAACGHTSGSVFANGGEVVDAGGEVVDASGDEPPCSTLPPADPCPTGVCSCGLGCDLFSCYMCTGGGYVAVNDCPPPPWDAGPSTAIGTFTAPDCPGCKFPNKNATSCDANAPTIAVAYPLDGVLLPPNLNALSIQWTPYGGYSTYELDFSNALTDMRIITKCTSQTMDTGQPSTVSGGCEMVLRSGVMTFLTSANRGGDPITLNVRGTTDGKCASSSPKSVTLSFANADMFGAVYYWKSTASVNGVGGQIWAKDFGDARAERQVTGTAPVASSCNGCHVLSRNGSRMVVYSDEDDSDDEYGDMAGSLVDVATMTPLGVSSGTAGAMLPVGFGTFSPDRSYVLTSNGIGASPTNAFAIWSGANGASGGAVAVGASGDRPTMPDWSPDGISLAYVLPTKVASWNSGARIDDDHVFGGSLYTMPYSGGGQFGTSRPLVTSAGENNYYPSYSPDGRFVLFDRAPLDMGVAAVDGCTGTASHLPERQLLQSGRARHAAFGRRRRRASGSRTGQRFAPWLALAGVELVAALGTVPPDLQRSNVGLDHVFVDT
jgi:hypothetical protein